jgi:ABC-type multidrug transport system ATPase subunit
VEATCDRAVILIDGRIRADGTLRHLTQSRVQVVRLATEDPGRTRQLLEELRGVVAVKIGEDGDARFRTFRLQLEGDADPGEAIFELARQHGWALSELRRDDQTLEQVFRDVTESAAEVAA